MHQGWVVSLILVVFIVFIKFVPAVNRLFCNSDRLGFKYTKSSNKDANEIVDNLNYFADMFQKKTIPCSKTDNVMVFPRGLKCEVVKKFVVEFINSNIEDEDAVKVSIEFMEKTLKKLCLPDGTIDPDKFTATYKAIYKMFCV
jgi:hypothetical protein